MATKVRIDGLRELEKALSELPKATGKSILRRVLVKRAQPLAEHATRIAPEDDGHLKKNIVVSTARPKGHKSGAAQAFARAGGGAAGRAAAKAAGSGPVEVFVGPAAPEGAKGPVPQSTWQEFGTVNHPPQPYMRPAWDAEQGPLLAGLKSDLWAEVKKSADRLAKKQARLAAKGA